jgi:hypothetical protein
MGPKIIFALLREGTSDDGLLTHLRELLVRSGASSASGTSREYRGSVLSKLGKLMSEETLVDLVFIHRDADNTVSTPRYEEIDAAVTELGCPVPCVPVVPIQELEAWLLADESAIRSVVGRPSGREDLGLPRLAAIEGTSDPKSILQNACLVASDKRGRRREQERKSFSLRRRTLLERLDIEGPVRQLSSWRRLEEDIAGAVERCGQ